MKNLKEKQLLVNLAKTLGQKADEEIVKELREFDRIKTEARKSVSKDPMSYILEAARKLNEEPKMDTPEYPLPPSLDELQEMLKDIPELKPEDRIEVLEGEEEWASKAIDESEETLIEKSVKFISEAPKESFQQPDPPKTSADIQAIVNKLKYLEQWMGKISMAGPGSGEVKLRFLDDVDRSTIQDGHFLRYNGTSGKFEFVEVKSETALQDTGEPMGHVNRLESSISFDSSTRTFSIEPVSASFTIYTRGTKRTITDTRTVTVANATGLYYISFDPAGDLRASTSFFDWPNVCPTAYVYWNQNTQTAPFVADERHGITLDWATHEYLHRTRGAAYANGFTASGYNVTGDGSSNTHAQITISNGTFFDEDLQVDIVHSETPATYSWEQHLQNPARIPIFYKINSAWVVDIPTDYPLKLGAVRPVYNANPSSTGGLNDIQNNKFGITYILATNNLLYPVIGILGQQVYDTLAQAQAISYNDLVLTGFPVVELRPLYRIIYQVKDSYTNFPKAAFIEVKDIRKDSSIQVI